MSDNSCGDVYTGIAEIKKQKLYTQEYHPLCLGCEAFQCINCIDLNVKNTGEINVSPSFYCRKSQIERKIAIKYIKEMYPETIINEKSVMDPIENILQTSYEKNPVGYYVF